MHTIPSCPFPSSLTPLPPPQAVSTLLELSDVKLSGTTLTAKAKVLAPAGVKDKAPAGSPLAIAAAAPDALLPESTKAFDATNSAIVVDGVDPAVAVGDKGWLGAAVGAGVGYSMCGLGCGIGGAAIGGWVG